MAARWMRSTRRASILVGCRRRCQVLVEAACVGFRDVPVDEFTHHHALSAPKRPANFDFVPDPQAAVLLGGLTVDAHPSGPARMLSVRARPEQAGHVEPDVKADSFAIRRRHAPDRSRLTHDGEHSSPAARPAPRPVASRRTRHRACAPGSPSQARSARNVPRCNSSKACRSCSCVFITIGPYQATGSSIGVPDTSRNRTPSSPA